MTYVTATKFQQNVGNYSDAALREPVIITNHNREYLVLMDVEEYNRLKQIEKQMSKERKATMEEIFDTHKDTFEKLALR